ncbi:MAG: 4Fe-4S dicluster domain-containing protein [Parachlamydiaceae bacterium]
MNELELSQKLQLLDELQSPCTYCGLCSEGCATFQATGWEHESPRGRLLIASRFLHGQIEPNSDALSTFDRCLGCRACESLCPQHVQYHQVRQVVQELRRDLKSIVSVGNHRSLESKGKGTQSQSQWSKAPSSSMTSALYHQWIKFASRVGSKWWRYYGAKWLKIPQTDIRAVKSFSSKSKNLTSAQSLPTRPAVLVVCCMQDLFQHQAIEEAIACVKKLGEEIGVDWRQPCCGAIFNRLVEGGEESICYPHEQKKALHLQTKTKRSFMEWIGPSAYFLSRGCQCSISKEEGRGRDLYEWMEHLLIQKKLALQLPVDRLVYYQPYCRSQKNDQDSILRLLKRIKRLTVNEMAYPLSCCGGYCGESVLHEAHAKKMAEEKLHSLPCGATLVVASPDCWSLFQSFAGSKEWVVCYPSSILMEAQLLPINAEI